MVVNNCPVSSC